MLKSTKVRNWLSLGAWASLRATSGLSTLTSVSVALASVALVSCGGEEASPPGVSPALSSSGGVSTGDCASIDPNWRFHNCSDPNSAYWVGLGPAPTTGAPTTGLPPTSGTTVSPTTGVGVQPTTSSTTVSPPASVAPVTSVSPTASVSPVSPTVSPTTSGAVSPTSDAVSPTTSGTVDPVSPGGADPDGYWRQDTWQGCVWTGIDDTNSGTTISPQDFTAGADGGYCVAGNVAATEGWLGVGLLGFNLNQAPDGADCTYKPVDVNAEGPPAVELTKTGLAINFVKRGDDKTFTLRAQIQGPNGASDANDRWCANIIEAQGKELIEWGEFNTECWEGGEGTDYNGEPISAIVFTVPGNGWAEGEQGTADDVPFDFCINGLAAGDSPEDAPEGGIEQEDLTGVIGGEATGADYERVKVSADGESYVIQNNNWGNEAGSQSISFVNNSFTVTDGPDGSPSCQGCPLSFPSIYIGASGNTDLGKYATRSSDNLPAAISAIKSANSSVSWSGSPGGAANATYDIWFAKTSRGDLTDKRYNDGLDGFIMLWLHDPNGGGSAPQPIGSKVATTTLNNISWDIWVGPRGQGPSSDGADLVADGQAPVISYVATSDVGSFNGDLKPFFDDATNRSGQFTSDLLLTDVFFGFEIWNPVSGLKVDNFSVKVEK